MSHRPECNSAVAGVVLTAGVASVALILAAFPLFQGLGLGALTLAIVFGIVGGNTVFPSIAARVGVGVDFSKTILLRVGIVLFGFRVSFGEIAEVGWTGATVAASVVVLTFALALYAGTRLFGLDRRTSILIGTGSAICGAAAILATEAVVRGDARRVAVAVATVVAFGTLGMFAYPLIYPYLGMSAHEYGIFVGSTLHEVAQVLAAGNAVGEGAARAAVIEKMLRVMMLAPFLLVLSCMSPSGSSRTGIIVPWFAVLFIAAGAIRSLEILPTSLLNVLGQIDTLLLTMAMAALGLRTSIAAVREAGLRPLLLAGLLFVFLIIGGYAVNVIATQLFQ